MIAVLVLEQIGTSRWCPCVTARTAVTVFGSIMMGWLESRLVLLQVKTASLSMPLNPRLQSLAWVRGHSCEEATRACWALICSLQLLLLLERLRSQSSVLCLSTCCRRMLQVMLRMLLFSGQVKTVGLVAGIPFLEGRRWAPILDFGCYFLGRWVHFILVASLRELLCWFQADWLCLGVVAWLLRWIAMMGRVCSSRMPLACRQNGWV